MKTGTKVQLIVAAIAAAATTATAVIADGDLTLTEAVMIIMAAVAGYVAPGAKVPRD